MIRHTLPSISCKDNDNSRSGSLKRSRVTVRLFSSRGMFELLLWHERDNPNYSRIMSTVITYYRIKRDFMGMNSVDFPAFDFH